jgi:predicted ATP-grasp superfamily ATP-dependent carboligase
MKIANVVIGSYINGYSIVQELYENDVREIIVLDTVRDVAARSNKIKTFFKIENSKESILKCLEEIKKSYEKLILYPNQDIFVEHLCNLYDQIKDFCFTAFNPENAITFQNKLIQYDFCHKLGVPCPQIVSIRSFDDKIKLLNLKLPLLLKPTKRDNLKSNIFRTKVLETKEEIEEFFPILEDYIANGFQFIASEIIPGDGSNIYAYTGYRKKDGSIAGEWIGKKLSQFPNDFGVFSSASNEAPEILIEQSRILLNGMNLWGINEPEYKFDYRDGKYKLMEINLRPMMWHRVGALSGVPLNYIQYLDAVNKKIPNYVQNQKTKIHYIYLNHEIINLLTRKNYFKVFRNNIFGGEKRVLALWDSKDKLPFFYSFFSIYRRFKKTIKRRKHDTN